ncbi:MAG: hypothetical protein ABFR62_11505 [Bacteroidota bacterium]
MNLQAQEAEVEFTPDTTKFLIGDQINVLLQAKAPKDSLIEWPVLSDTIGKLEVVSRSKIDTLIKKDFQIISQNYKLTQFDSGSYVINPVRFKIGEKILYTKPKMIDVTTVAVDTTKQKMYEIKGNIHVGYNFREILPYILMLLIIAAIIYMGYYFWKKQKPRKKKVFIPSIPPFDMAMQNLKKLDKTQLLKEGNVKEYYVRLTDILRRYIEDEHHIPALESTTDEIMSSIYQIDLNSETRDKIRELLKESDFVKFAKYQPESGKHVHYRKTTEEIIIASQSKSNVDIKKANDE